MSENPIRRWRTNNGYSLDAVCGMFEERGFAKPSAAKLSRIERDQLVPAEMIPAVTEVTGIPAKTLRPDLAELFGGHQ